MLLKLAIEKCAFALTKLEEKVLVDVSKVFNQISFFEVKLNNDWVPGTRGKLVTNRWPPLARAEGAIQAINGRSPCVRI